MLTRVQQLIIGIITVLLMSVNANAQSTTLDFSYTQKTQTISLAKQGNAEAFYTLGLAHLHGINSPQNDTLAERFFFYAAQKGHPDAKRYLEQLTATPPSPALIGVSDAPTSSPIYTQSQPFNFDAGVMAKDVIAEEVIIAEEVTTKVVDAEKNVPEQITAETEIPSHEKVLSAVVDLTKDVKNPAPVILEETIETEPVKDKQVVKLASNDTNKSLTASVARPQYRSPSDFMTTTTSKTLGFWKSINKYLLVLGVILVAPIILIPLAKYTKPITNIFVICGLGIFIFFGLVFRFFMQKFGSEAALPEGFSKQAYLDLNPDVRDSGADVVQHYLKHGIHEGRKYKY